MNENKCFNCKNNDLIAYNCFQKRKIVAISDDVSEDNNSERKK